MSYQKNQLVTAEITDMSSEGEGIGKIDGYPFFVKDAIIGDVAEIRITKVKKNYSYGRLEKVITPSPFRVLPDCKFHRQCGGCQIQAMDYARQLTFKENKVRNNLIRIGGFAPELIDEIMEPIVGMEEPFRYRNKAQYPIGLDKDGNPIAGFYAGRTHNIIANTDCLLGVEENGRILEIILAYMKEYKVSAYDETTGKGLLRHVLIRKSFANGQIMVCLVINMKLKKSTDTSVKAGVKESGTVTAARNCNGSKGEETGKSIMPEFLPAQEVLTDRLRAVPGMTSISVSINTENTNVIMGKEVYTIWGEDCIKDTIHVRDTENNFAPMENEDGITFSISPLSFYQVNPVQMEKLYSIALDYAGLTGKETVWDLYCGIGTISLFLAQKAGQVYGVEIVPQAIEDAKHNAAENHMSNAQFFVGKAEEVLPQKYEAEGIFADVIVVDPPRKGCDSTCLETMLKMQPERIVYVSCDSATLARDLKILCEGGYELKRARVADLFPMTIHTETVVLLSQQKPDDVIEVEIELDELDLTSAESKATYAEIKDYVLKEHGLKVSNLYISQVKRKCGIEVGENYNLPKSEDSRQPQCPEKKEKAIKDALEHFGMV